MMRRLLIIEASAHPKPNTRPLLHPQRQRVGKLTYFHPDKPEAWRVTFRSFLGDTHAHAAPGQDEQIAQGACVSPRRSRRFRDAWPIAERYEALLRVFNNPAPYARRLSRRLHATPHRPSEVLRAPPEAEQRIDRFAEMGACAAGAVGVTFCDTS